MKTILMALMMLVAAQAPGQPPAPPAPGEPAADEYVVGVGDELQLKVFGEDDMSRERLVVDADGTIDVPQLGRVVAAGKTPRQIQDSVADQLIERKIFVQRPSVAIRVIVFRSQTIRVEGQVRNPGIIVMEGMLSLADAIYKAQGFTPDAGPVVHVYRPRPDDASAAAVDRKPDLEISRDDVDGGRAVHIRLQDGDRVHVPRAPTFKITGYVRSPAIYTWRPKLTVWEAVSALAGGLTERGAKGRIQIFRVVNGYRQTINVRRPEEELVQPDDTINVRGRII
jgi:polysaccharide export outer membrane protein